MDEYVRAAPAPHLRRYVAHYSGYRQRDVPSAQHLGLPSPYLTLIFTLDEPLTIASHPDPRQPPADYDALVGGLHTTPALITHDGAQSGLQLAVSPLGARALLGHPAGELSGIDVPGSAVLGGVVDEMRMRLQAASSWRARFDVVDQVLLRLVDSNRDLALDIAPEVVRAWSRVTGSGGAVSVSALAADTGWSRRHLSERFRSETGLTPKLAARVTRFDRARRLLTSRLSDTSHPPLRLADLAARCGYADQSHLARDFRDLAGRSPRQWVADEFPNVQADGHARAPQWSDIADDCEGASYAREHHA